MNVAELLLRVVSSRLTDIKRDYTKVIPARG